MKTEYLSVVDENDLVINSQPRDKIHALGLRHRAVHILVFNDQGQLFLQKRSMKKDLNKGLWDTSAAGHVDKDEDYTSSAIREAAEELGINIESTLQLLFKLSPTPLLGMEFIHVYRCQHNGPFSLNADKIDEGKWLSTKEVSNRVRGDDSSLTETFKIIWRQYGASNK